MGKIGAFVHVTIDGFFAGPKGEIDWFKSIEKDEEFDAYTHGQAQSGGMLMLGRTTYEMMQSYWPTEEARKADPQMAAVMDNSPKIAFSKSLKSVEEGPHWKNVKLVHEIDRDAILAMKKQADITILGSGSIVQQLTNLGLIDAYQLIFVPLVLGKGKYLFKDTDQTNLRLQDAKHFRNGIVVVRYGRA